jgi:ribose transport system permease protein
MSETRVSHVMVRRGWRAWKHINPAVVVLLALVVAISLMSPLYRTPAGLMILLQRAAPLVVLTCGQTFVLATGGFDLSVGSIMTLAVIGCALLTGGDPSLTAVAIGAVAGLGLFIGIVNGVVVSWLKVPSIIATLGMLLSAKGFAMRWSGGSPAGLLPDNLRMFGRFAWRNVPLVGTLPFAVLILVVAVALMAWLLHGTSFGRLILMIGDNPRAAELAGVPVRRIRAAAFVISALSAVVAGILLGGFSGVSVNVGTGFELQAISAAVIGGVALLGGAATIGGAVTGALTLYALFTLLNLIGFPEPLRVAVQGLILIAAAGLSARRQ